MNKTFRGVPTPLGVAYTPSTPTVYLTPRFLGQLTDAAENIRHMTTRRRKRRDDGYGTRQRQPQSSKTKMTRYAIIPFIPIVISSI